MINIRRIDHSFDDLVRLKFRAATRANVLGHRAFPNVAAKSSLYLVSRQFTFVPMFRREDSGSSGTFRRNRRSNEADCIFVALALCGVAAMCSSVW